MTQDVTAGIGISIDSAGALAQLRQLQAGISQFNQSVMSTNAAAVAKQQDLIKVFAANVESSRKFSTSIQDVETSVHRLGKSIDTGKLGLREYFRYGAAASGKFGKVFAKESKEIDALATERVKKLQTQYVALGQARNGMVKSLAVRPEELFGQKVAVNTQRMQLFNKLMTDGSTSLINWGKNTQWAGRQLMVGFSMPLAVFGAAAVKVFRDIEMAMVSFRRVYGDTMTTAPETEKALNDVKALAMEYTKYGIAVSDTISLAAKAAALGAQGPNLIAQTKEATRLATLGQIDYQQALDTTISLQSAFGISAEDLATNIDFLNAVENQTVLSIDDVTQAIPKVAPVIKALGGNVQDLTYMLTAMREGGVNAAEGSNALKSGLMSLINPTQAAIDKAKELGIDLQGIVESNAGNLPGMIKAVGEAFNSIDDGLKRQQLMGKVFGKYQVARMTAMFTNISKEGGQASRVLDLMGKSTEGLANISEKELGKIENAISIKFQGSLERLKAEIAPLGQEFLKALLPIMDGLEGILKWFNGLDDGFKSFLVWGTVIGGVVVPVVTMLVGLFANMAGLIFKLAKNPLGFLVNGFKNAGQSAKWLATSQIDSEAAAASLEGRTTSLTGALNMQASAVQRLVAAYDTMSVSAANALRTNSNGFRMGKLKGYAKGRVQIVGGNGNGKKDTELAMVAPGEAIINAEDSKRYATILDAMNKGQLQGFAGGRVRVNMGDKGSYYGQASGKKAEVILPTGEVKEFKAHASMAAGKLEEMANDVYKLGSQFSGVFVKAIEQVGNAAISLNNIADKLIATGVKPLADIGNQYKTTKGLGAPNDFAAAKERGFANNPGLKKYFTNQFDSVVADVRAYAKQTGQKVSAGSLTEKDFGSHISHTVKTTGDEGGKMWLKNRVAVDSGYINRYLQDVEKSLGRTVQTFTKMNAGGQNLTDAETRVANAYLESAKEFGLSADKAKAELARLAQGLHPLTTDAYRAVAAIGKMDTQFAAGAGYQGKTAMGTDASASWKSFAAMQAAKYAVDNNGARYVNKSKGFFGRVKDTMWQKGANGQDGKYRAMADAEIEAATKATDGLWRRINTWATKFGKQALTSVNGANLSLDAANAALGINSPSLKIVKFGQGVMEGSMLAVKAVDEGGNKLKIMIDEFGVVTMGSTKTTVKAIDNAAGWLQERITQMGFQIKSASNSVVDATAISGVGAGIRSGKSMPIGGGAAMGGGIGGGKFQGIMSAISALSMIGTMLPGQIGELSSNIMMASFGLQALTGAMQGMAIVSKATSAGGFLAPIARFAPLAGTALGALVSPAGLVVAALGALAGIAWIIYNNYQEEQKKLHAFGEALKTTTDTLQSAADAFGYSLNPSTINTKTEDKSKEGLQRAVTAQSYVRDIAASDTEVGKAFKSKLDFIKTSSAAQAEQVLRQTFLSLIASGAPGDVAKAIVEQMANETNRQNIFKGMSQDLSDALDPKGKIKDVAVLVNKTMAPAFRKAAQSAKEMAEQQKLIADLKAKPTDRVVGTVFGEGNLQDGKTQKQIDEAQKRLEELKTEAEQTAVAVPAAIQQTATDLNTLMSAGMISQKQFEEGFGAIKSSVEAAFPGQQIQQATAYTDAIKGMGVELNFAAPGLEQASIAAATLNAVMAGADPSDINNALTSAAGNAALATQALYTLANAAMSNPVVNGSASISSIQGQINAVKGQIASASKAGKKKGKTGGGGGGGGGQKKSKYDKKSDAIAKANARLDIQEVKIDKTEDAKIQAAMDKRWGGKTIEINGLKVTVKHAADIEYAMQQIDEQIEDINRNQIDPLNDKLDVLQDKQDKINRQIAVWQQEIDKLNESYDAQTKPLERANALLEDQQSAIEETRDKQLQGIEAQTTALQNQIDVAQYAADQAGKLIDDQITKNDLNIELIDKQSQAIDDQISALQEVQKINEIIAAQKQSQLDLASALSKGDAGAAAAAMLGAQGSAASGASELQQAGLEGQSKVLQDQSAALSAQNDLLSKRKDAIDKGVDALNRQLDALNQQKTLIEDNYKLELLGIENAMADNSARLRQLEYERTVRTQYWQDQIDKYAPELRDLDNQIYGIEQQIKKIQDEKIKPLERQKDLLEDILGDVQQQLDREKAIINEKRRQLDFANKINNAMKTLHDRMKAAGGASGGISAGLASGGKSIDDLKKKLARLQEQLKTEKFKMAVEQGMVTRDKNGNIKVFDSPGKAAQYVSEVFGNAKVLTKNDIEGTAKINGKTVKGDYNTIAKKMADALDNSVKKQVVTQLVVDHAHRTVRIRGNAKNKEYSLDGKMWFGTARGGLTGGVLPGFRGVTHGDNILQKMRSGEGVTVSEALRRNKYETSRLYALNKAALSGNMSSFYREWNAPEIGGTIATVAPQKSDPNKVEYNFDIDVNVPGTNVSAREIKAAVKEVVIEVVTDAQRGQIRSR